MSIFSKKKVKSYLERNPAATVYYSSLNDTQKSILDEFNAFEQTHRKDDVARVLQRIADENNHWIQVPKAGGSIGKKAFKAAAKTLFDRAKHILQTAPPTTNISSKLFVLPGFLDTTSVDTMWTRDAGKGWKYTQSRDNVEAPLFGYKTDWSVPIQQASLNRPVYAGLNYVRHPYGSAAAYGSVVLTFVPAVTQRVTIIHADTFSNEFGLTSGTPSDDQIMGVKKKIATIAQVETIMANMSKNQFKALIEYTLSRYNYTEYPPNYVEIHVQGGLEWQRDLLEISVATSGTASIGSESKTVTGGEPAVKAKIKEFAEKYDVTAKVYDVERVVEVLNTGSRSARVA